MQVQVLSPSPLGVVGEAPVSCEITAGRPGRPPSTAGISSLRHARGGEAGGHGRARCEKAFLDEPEGPLFGNFALIWPLLCSLGASGVLPVITGLFLPCGAEGTSDRASSRLPC